MLSTLFSCNSLVKLKKKPEPTGFAGSDFRMLFSEDYVSLPALGISKSAT